MTRRRLARPKHVSNHLRHLTSSVSSTAVSPRRSLPREKAGGGSDPVTGESIAHRRRRPVGFRTGPFLTVLYYVRRGGSVNPDPVPGVARSTWRARSRCPAAGVAKSALPPTVANLDAEATTSAYSGVKHCSGTRERFTRLTAPGMPCPLSRGHEPTGRPLRSRVIWAVA